MHKLQQETSMFIWLSVCIIFSFGSMQNLTNEGRKCAATGFHRGGILDVHLKNFSLPFVFYFSPNRNITENQNGDVILLKTDLQNQTLYAECRSQLVHVYESRDDIPSFSSGRQGRKMTAPGANLTNVKIASRVIDRALYYDCRFFLGVATEAEEELHLCYYKGGEDFSVEIFVEQNTTYSKTTSTAIICILIITLLVIFIPVCCWLYLIMKTRSYQSQYEVINEPNFNVRVM